MWSQGYDPLGNAVLSTLLAATPIIILLTTLGWLKWKAHLAALTGLATALVIAVLVFGMPASMAVSAAVYGAAFGLLPIGYIVLNALFLYNLCNESGLFKTLRESITSVTPDRRLQVLLVAFGFGAFMEGGAGLGAPIAVVAAMMIGLGFPPLAASGLALVANTIPVPFGALGTPIVTLQAVSQLDLLKLSIATAWQLAPFCIIVPFWVVWVFAGFQGTMAVWPAILLAGVAYVIPLQLVAINHGPWLASVIASLVSMGSVVLLLRVWHPKEIWTSTGAEKNIETKAPNHAPGEVLRAWTPWIILTVCVLIWVVILRFCQRRGRLRPAPHQAIRGDLFPGVTTGVETRSGAAPEHQTVRRRDLRRMDVAVAVEAAQRLVALGPVGRELQRHAVREPRGEPVSVALEPDRDEVHRRRADESGDEAGRRRMIELVRRTDLLDPPMVHHHDPVGQRHRLDLVVRDVDRGGPHLLVHALDLDAHLHAELGVQVRQRLVEQEDLGIAHDRPAHRDALALAAGERLGLAVEKLGNVEDARRLVDPSLDLGLGIALEPQPERHVLGHRHVWVERVVLEHHRDVPVLRRHVVDDDVVDRDLAVGDLLEPGDHAERRRLAAA